MKTIVEQIRKPVAPPSIRMKDKTKYNRKKKHKKADNREDYRL